MRPSGAVTCEPGLERGIPWGRDLFTFVTSAAGHMMRTLQRPRKNRPSKRQVNHRRFLHNMIHRKFAEIEAANRQLASAIFSRDQEDVHSISPCQLAITDQSDEDGHGISQCQLAITDQSDEDGHGISQCQLAITDQSDEDGHVISPCQLAITDQSDEDGHGISQCQLAITDQSDEDGHGISLCQLAITDQSDEKRSIDLASPLQEIIPPFCLPGEPEPVVLPEGQSDMWAFNFQLENFGEQILQAHSHTLRTVSQTSDMMDNHLTPGRGNLTKMGGDIMFGELKLCELPSSPGAYFNLEEDPLKLDIMRLTEAGQGKNTGDSAVDIQIQNLIEPLTARGQNTSDPTEDVQLYNVIEPLTARAQNTSDPAEDVQLYNVIEPLTARAELSCREKSVLKSTPVFPAEPQSPSPCVFGTDSITNAQCSQNNRNDIEKAPQTGLLDNFDVIGMSRHEKRYVKSVSFWGAEDEDVPDEDVPDEDCSLHFGSVLLNCTDSYSLNCPEEQQFSSEYVKTSRGQSTSNNSSCSNTSINKTSHLDPEGSRKSLCYRNQNEALRAVFNQGNSSNPHYFTAMSSTAVTYDQLGMHEATEHDDNETHLRVRRPCSYDLAKRSHYDRRPHSSIPPFSRLFHNHHIAFECMQSDMAQQVDLKALGCSKATLDHLGNSSAECVGNSCCHIQRALPCRVAAADHNLHPFVGVARAFPVTSSEVHFTRIVSPPVEEGWLFDDITEGQPRGREKDNFMLKGGTRNDTLIY